MNDLQDQLILALEKNRMLKHQLALTQRAVDWCLENSAARRQGGIVNMSTWNERWLEVPAEFSEIIKPGLRT